MNEAMSAAARMLGRTLGEHIDLTLKLDQMLGRRSSIQGSSTSS